MVNEQPLVVNPLSVSIQPSGKKRLILDLRDVNNSYLRASLCKILISSFAHKTDFAHNFPVDFF